MLLIRNMFLQGGLSHLFQNGWTKCPRSFGTNQRICRKKTYPDGFFLREYVNFNFHPTLCKFPRFFSKIFLISQKIRFTWISKKKLAWMRELRNFFAWMREFWVRWGASFTMSLLRLVNVSLYQWIGKLIWKSFFQYFRVRNRREIVIRRSWMENLKKRPIQKRQKKF